MWLSVVSTLFIERMFVHAYLEGNELTLELCSELAKNYSKEIDQNLIYITEKYLFDAALRNVAIIISRKGFSKSAKFAAEGCLKEHGKLILDITNEDLTKMLELRSDQAADYFLDKLEEFLMGISK